ncbi:hypothetical protein [Paenibacillus sp. Marseille-Q9583]
MTKLGGNERSKTKMIMTEHVEQYEEQQRENPDEIITTEERTMVRDLILLPYIDTMVGKILKELEHSSSSILKRTLLMAGEAIQCRIMQDTY